MKLHHLTAFLAGITMSSAVFAHDYKAGDLQVGHPWARPTVPGQPSGGAYLSIENTGKTADKLLSVTSPVAKASEIHTMSMEGNTMKMREVGTIEVKPSEKIAMVPGNGYHVMLIGLSQPLKAGDKFPMTLTFEKAGKIDVSVYVEDKSADNDKGGMGHMHH